MAKFFVSLFLLYSLAVVGIRGQGTCVGGVPFCNSIQILTGQCATECARSSTTPQTPTSSRRPGRSTTPSASVCESGVQFCPTIPTNATVNATECNNGTAPLQLSYTTLGTLLQTGNATMAGLSAGMVSSLAQYFTTLGSTLSRQ
ncbi:uncharacterized protein LOC110847640 [Folsomia candida]|uniref:Uncharacterized protein n=1 Tax=Folsomia candida TaxID=158441 RepID=A0A226EJY3_FOLCA|nr:uncharacterized protein LOC110847640 [Folsomia candida]OXA57314.1 hypothetical protein Fcan01_06465 [Folsomia candida]